MRRNIAVLLLVLLVSVGIAPVSVSAHVLQTDGNIGAVLHINPEDNPVSGVPTTYLLAFEDTTGHFSMSKCNCNAMIIEQGHTVSTTQLTATDSLDAKATTTFPSPDVYTLHISGQPKQPGAFQSFLLTYILRVQSGTGSTNVSKPIPTTLWLGLGLLAALLLLGGYELADTSDKRNKDGGKHV